MSYPRPSPGPSPTPRDSSCREDKLQLIAERVLKTASDFFSDEDKARMIKLCQSFADVFATGRHELGRAKNLLIDVELKEGAKPVRQPPRKFRLDVREEIEAEVQELLRLGLIRDASSEWAAPVVPVRKPDKSLRLCADYRGANSQIKDVSSSLALPDPWQTLEDIASKKPVGLVSCDLLTAFAQAGLTERAQQILTFIVDSGTYAPVVAPYGLKTLPGLWNIFVRRVAANAGLSCGELKVFCDDLLFGFQSVDEALEKFARVLGSMRGEGLTLKLSKLCVLQRTLQALGYEYHAGSQKVTATEDRIKALLDFPTPKTKKGIRSWCGSIGWLRKMLPKLSLLTAPLTKLTGEGSRFQWGEEQQESFDAVKRIIAQGPYVVLPGPEDKLRIKCDASVLGWSAALESEVVPGTWAPACVISKQWSGAGTHGAHLGSTEAEARAALAALRALRVYIYGRKSPTELITDHAALSQLVRCKSPKTQTLAKLALEIDDCNVKVVWKPGKYQEEEGQDGCSRFPVGVNFQDDEVGRERVINSP